MCVRHLEAGNHEADAQTVDCGLLSLAYVVSDIHQMPCRAGVQISPLINFDFRNDENMARVERSDIKHDNALFIVPDKPARDLATNDAGENRRHSPKR